MANRNFNRQQALEKEVKTIFAEVDFGASGAPTLTSGLGIASIARDSAGTYTMTLEDRYVKLLGVSGVLLDAAAEDIRLQLSSEDVDGNREIGFFTLTGATETDPSDGSKMFITLHLRNSSVG